MEHFSWISFWAKQWKKLPIAATCMHNLDWLYDIHTLPPHLQETKSWKVYISSSHHLFITSTFTLQHLAPWRANARPKREAPRTPRLRAVWRLQCAPQAWINQMVFLSPICHLWKLDDAGCMSPWDGLMSLMVFSMSWRPGNEVRPRPPKSWKWQRRRLRLSRRI